MNPDPLFYGLSFGEIRKVADTARDSQDYSLAGRAYREAARVAAGRSLHQEMLDAEDEAEEAEYLALRAIWPTP